MFAIRWLHRDWHLNNRKTKSYKECFMALESQKIDIKPALQAKADSAEQVLRRLLDNWQGVPDILAAAVDYTLTAPGKRVRAAIVFWVCEMFSDSDDSIADASSAAAAIEMVHTYSLIHDDLPAMDDDDFRRGRESCHKKFDEATAILAGDALLTMAFEVLSRDVTDEVVAVEMIRILTRAAGPAGMIAGQVDDMQAEKTAGNAQLLKQIHTNKTARMFEAAALLGAVAGRASVSDKDKLGEFGLKLGLCFQIADDILDTSASTAQLGKTAGKDAANGKLTYPSLFGIDESKNMLTKLSAEAIEAIDGFGPKADTLVALTEAMMKRTK